MSAVFSPARAASPSTPYRDHKRYLWLCSPGVCVFLYTALFGYERTGNWLFLAIPFIVAHILFPIADSLLGEDKANPPPEAFASLEQDSYYTYVVWLFVPLQYIGFFWAMDIVGRGGLPLLHWLCLAHAVGWCAGLAINTGHELAHKLDFPSRLLARITLAQPAYGHFIIEHTRGHHRNVATPGDPASSRMGESFWQFLPRTVATGLVSAWNIEARRLRAKGCSAWNIMENENLKAWAWTVGLFALCVAKYGAGVLPFLFAQAAYGASLLEVVNYLEHYGLLRREYRTPEGKLSVEPCLPMHSWNSNHIATNIFLYHLQRHSDHHAHPTRRYQSLRHFENAPQLISGYGTMVVVAYFPWVWFNIMDKRLIRHCQGDWDRINVHPPARERLMKQYGAFAAEVYDKCKREGTLLPPPEKVALDANAGGEQDAAW